MFKRLFDKDLICLISCIRPRIWAYLIGMLGFCIAQASLGTSVAFVTKDVFDAAGKGKFSLLINAVITMGAVTLLLSTAAPFFRYMFSKCVKKTMTEIRLKVFRHIEHMPVLYFEENHSGDTVSRITNDLMAMERAYSEDLNMIIFSVMLCISTVVSMFVLDYRVAVLLVLLGAISAYINARFSKALREISNNIQSQMGALTERLMDILAGYHIIKMFHIEQLINNKFDKENGEVTLLSESRVKKNSALEGTNYLLGMLNFAGIVTIGAFMVINKMVEFGTLTALVQLQTNLIFVVLQLGEAVARLQGSLAGASRIFELLDIETEKIPVLAESGNNEDVMVGLRDVVFGYNSEKNVLDHLDLMVEKGKVAALVGPSGGGKSTVVKLLQGFYPVSGGEIVINGKSIGEYTLGRLRSMIAYVPQDAYLFDGTIEENIRYGKSDASTEAIVRAAKAANAHEFITALPDGYNTLVGERGGRLSGGQRQRIAIARAFLKDSPILLLDEATSALDNESEKLVQEALNDLIKGRTVIIVAHRLSTIEKSDIIYVIENGRIVEQGKSGELVKGAGLYSRLYNNQYT